MRAFLLLLCAWVSAQSLPQVPLDAPPLVSNARLSMRYFHDKDDSNLVISDLVFPSPRRGIATGILQTKNRPEAVMVLTVDGGQNWREVELKDIPVSMFFLDESRGWYVGLKNLWMTEEGGSLWKKLRLPSKNGLERVYFTSPERGWIFGKGKTVWSTVDGGNKWTKMPETEELKVTDENTTFRWMSFSSPERGLLVGNSQRPQRTQLPTWMSPESAMMRRQTPATVATLETVDGGKTWKPSVVSAFGSVTRAEFGSKGGFAIFRYSESFDWPSEVIRLEANASRSVFRRKDRIVTDGMIGKDGTLYLTTIEPVGRITTSPIPGKLHLLRSTDWKTWEEIPVDYRAAGRTAFIAIPDDKSIWVATDEGMILQVLPR